MLLNWNVHNPSQWPCCHLCFGRSWEQGPFWKALTWKISSYAVWLLNKVNDKNWKHWLPKGRFIFLCWIYAVGTAQIRRRCISSQCLKYTRKHSKHNITSSGIETPQPNRVLECKYRATQANLLILTFLQLLSNLHRKRVPAPYTDMSVSTTNGDESGSQVFGSLIYQHLLLIPVRHVRDIITVEHHDHDYIPTRKWVFRVDLHTREDSIKIQAQSGQVF